MAPSTAVGRLGRRPIPGWLGHVAATVVVQLAGTLPNHPHQQPAWSAEVVVFNLLVSALLLARRRIPFVVLPSVLVLLLASLPLGLFNAGTAVAAAIATYALALRGLPHPRGIVITSAVAAIVLAAALLADAPAPQNALVILFGAALGDAIHAQREHVSAITERAERAERTREAVARQRVAEDRLAIARDLHDVVAHQIAVISLHAGVAGSALRTRPDDAEASLAIVRDSSRTVLNEIGDLMATLRDPDNVDAGPPGLSQLDDIVRDVAAHGLDVALRTEGEPYELPAAIDVTALRVVQEALTNAHKHGSGHRAQVLLEYRPRALHITVANPVSSGSHASSRTHRLGTGNGLTGMRERVESVRGTLTYGREPEGAWLLVADLPTSLRSGEAIPAARRPGEATSPAPSTVVAAPRDRP